MKHTKEFLTQQYKEKGLIYIPQQIIGNVGHNSLILLVELFYAQYLDIIINTNNSKQKKYFCINKLIKNKFVTKKDKQDIYEIKDLIINAHKKQYNLKQNNCLNDNCCEWCNIQTMIIHKHHFPIMKSKGGINTVNICPNCHFSFHYLIDKEEVEITEKTINYFIDL